jgi:hypothetical protein
MWTTSFPTNRMGTDGSSIPAISPGMGLQQIGANDGVVSFVFVPKHEVGRELPTGIVVPE